MNGSFLRFMSVSTLRTYFSRMLSSQGLAISRMPGFHVPSEELAEGPVRTRVLVYIVEGTLPAALAEEPAQFLRDRMAVAAWVTRRHALRRQHAADGLTGFAHGRNHGTLLHLSSLRLQASVAARIALDLATSFRGHDRRLRPVLYHSFCSPPLR